MAEYRIGVRDLKTHLSSYLEKVQKGHTVIVTSHGKPIAQIGPTREELMDRVKALQAMGLIAWSGRKLKPAKPVAVNKSKKTASAIFLEMQNESLY